ncbi:hypothetical protein SteCoe_6810 [Stentor coeruleus]|uniref:Ammonium transporter AmtB-like domain-containing protein n=1 Tax=Stentor coeruleus TaxID=5963 RepID=A0A1R2CP29_9CILI|nr:hypothetical protein SteCoe_6810 [Stentor coeruleus]
MALGLPLAALALQIIVLLFYTICDNSSEPKDFRYANFQFVHLMIFVGFALLYGFLRRYSWTGLGQNFIIGVFAAEFYLVYASIIHTIYKNESSLTLIIDGKFLLCADFCAGAALVSFGVFIGKVSTLQMLIMAAYESFFYALNEHFVSNIFKTIDSGGGMTLHAFGCYFALAASMTFAPDKNKDLKYNSTNYISNIFAFTGTVLLWFSWPGFNAALAENTEDFYYAVSNTVIALFGSTVGAFITSGLLNNGKLSMVSIINATLSGGVAVGTACIICHKPGWASLLGFLTGGISAFGFEKITPFLEEKIGLQDIAGVNNLHGIPGIISMIFSLCFVSKDKVPDQFYGLLCSLGLSIGSGTLFGLFLRKTQYLFGSEKFFLDAVLWRDEAMIKELEMSYD